MGDSPDQSYFQSLNRSLRAAPRVIPCLLLDLDRLDHNIQSLKNDLAPDTDFRIVVKSLPSPELIDYLMDQVETKKLMAFHQPFLSDLSSRYGPDVDILLGKPMPVRTAAYYYQTLDAKNGFDPSRQLQWLVDSLERLQQYLELARQIDQKLRVNLEIDVGLHRGGFVSLESLSSALALIAKNLDVLEFSGLMGYDPHVVKLPRVLISPQKAFQKANHFYKECKALIQSSFSQLWNDQLTFNGGGSPTASLHRSEGSPINDLSAGSCLVKPTTFDLPTLEGYIPASFIATPVLKKMEGTTLPAIEGFKKILGFLKPAFQQSYFIYGGSWRADYCYPPDLSENTLFGTSTNQVMLNAPPTSLLEVDDFVFLRPHQSEFVFLQFGEILTLRDQKLSNRWTLLSQK